MKITKKIKSFLLLFTIVSVIFAGCNPKEKQTPESLGWELAYQSYTFKNFTFKEGLKKANTLGLKYVEAYPGQKLSPENQSRTHFTMTDSLREEMKTLLEESGIKLINYGVVVAKDEAEWSQIFDFAKEMGIETITASPKPEQYDFLEKMCDEYSINIAIHNHPQPSTYWSPDSVLKYCEGRSNRIGACADIGHWVRCGLNPVDCLKQLEGRIISLHFKDLNIKDKEAHDVPWGTGVCDIPAVLAELKRQEFKGIFSIEYEHNWDNSVPDIELSLKNFKEITANLE